MSIIKHGEVFANVSTGEILSKEEVKQYYQHKQIEEFNDSTQELLELGIEQQNKMTKRQDREESPMATVKEKHQFNKMFNIELEHLVFQRFFDKNEMLVLGALTPFIHFPYNDVVIRGKYYTFEELGELCFLSKNIIGKTLKSLQHKEVIYIVQAAKRPPVVYFNPFLYCGGGSVHRDTYDFFKDSVFKPNNKKFK
jgi:hypothetical protein